MQALQESRSEHPHTVCRRRRLAVLFPMWTLAAMQPVWSHPRDPDPKPSRTDSRPETMCSQGPRFGSAASESPDAGSKKYRPRGNVRFRAAALQVLVPVSVTDGSGRPVKGLHLEEFRLWEDGVEQPLDDILTEETPLTLGVVVDVSGSMRSKMKQTVHAFILEDIERHEKKRSSAPLTAAFEHMAREVRSHYLVSYSAARSELDGRWHSIRVELSRPDLLARYRPGYLALPLE